MTVDQMSWYFLPKRALQLRISGTVLTLKYSFSICAQKDSILKDSVIFGSFFGLDLTMWIMINTKHSKRKSL